MVEVGFKHRFYKKKIIQNKKEKGFRKYMVYMKGVGLGEVGHLRSRHWSMSRETGLLTCYEEYGHPVMIVSY